MLSVVGMAKERLTLIEVEMVKIGSIAPPPLETKSERFRGAYFLYGVR